MMSRRKDGGTPMLSVSSYQGRMPAEEQKHLMARRWAGDSGSGCVWLQL